MAVGFRWRWPALSRRRLIPACRGPVSPPRSSNRTCGFPASGSPTGFTARHTVDGHFRLVCRDDSPHELPRITRGRGGWRGLTPWKTFTSYPLPACPGALGSWLTREVPTTSAPRPVYPQQPTFWTRSAKTGYDPNRTLAVVAAPDLLESAVAVRSSFPGQRTAIMVGLSEPARWSNQ